MLDKRLTFRREDGRATVIPSSLRGELEESEEAAEAYHDEMRKGN
jgi:hypothetical protein